MYYFLLKDIYSLYVFFFQGSLYVILFLEDNFFLRQLICIIINQNMVIVSLAQLIWTMHKICKVWGSNPRPQKKKN